MVFIIYKEIDATKARVEYENYQPSELSEEIVAKGIYVDSIPQAENRPFQVSTLYINPETKELWHEYVDRPFTQEEKDNKEIAELRAENVILKEESAAQKIRNAGVQEDLNFIFETMGA
jgi:hypothetical protein